MQIQYKGQEKFEIKLKDTSIKVGYTISIDDFLLPGPGEYEKRGISVFGIPDGANTIYIIHAEDMTLCYLGKLSHGLSEEEAKQVEAVDILFLPLGEDGTLEMKTALTVLSKIDPKVVIPMLYNDIEEFKKNEGAASGEFDILKIKKADLPEDERNIYILNKS